MIIDDLFEGPQLCPECGGISFSDLILAEKKDACYYKVKASAKVWPSAYASGRLVQCRKKGAANYGNKSEGVAEGTRAPNEIGGADSMRQKLGDIIKQAAQDDEVVYNKPGLYRKLWITYGGDIDAIIAERSIFELQQLARELVTATKQGVAEGEVIPFKRPQSPTAVSWQKLPKDVLTLANDWFWADYEGSGLDATMDPKGLGSGYANQQKYLGAQLQQRGWAIDIDDEFENVVLKNKQGQTILLPIEDAQTFSGWATGTNPVTEQGVAEGGDVFKANIKDTAEYKAGLATGKLPVPHPEGTQEYANYYKGVIDKVSPTLSKVGEDDANFGKSATLMTPSSQAAQKAKDIVQQRADANVISQAKIAGAVPITREGEQQPGADYRDPKEVDYDDEYHAMVARVKKLAGLGPMKTVYDPNKRQYRNMPTAVQPKK